MFLYFFIQISTIADDDDNLLRIKHKANKFNKKKDSFFLINTNLLD